MSEYIEREKTIKPICEACNKQFPEEPCEPSDCTIMQILRAIPAADVRPVVLCRDCEYWQSDCGWCGYFDIGMNIDDFCSRGKKEES